MSQKSSPLRKKFFLALFFFFLLLYGFGSQTIHKEISLWKLRRYLVQSALALDSIHEENSYERKTLRSLDKRNKQKVLKPLMAAAQSHADKEKRFNAIYLFKEFQDLFPETLFPVLQHSARHDSEPVNRRLAFDILSTLLQSLSETHKASFLQTLTEAISQDPAPEVLTQILHILPQFYPQESLSLMDPFFHHPNPDLRCHSMVGIKLLAEPYFSQKVSTLATLCKTDPDSGVRLNALDTLKFRKVTTEYALYFFMVNQDPEPYVRLSAARALRALQIKESIPDLKKALQHPEDQVCFELCAALVEMGEHGEDVLEVLLKLFERNKSGSIFPVWLINQILQQMGSKAQKAIPLLREAFQDPSQRHKGSLVETLFLIDPCPEHLAFMREVLQEERYDEEEERNVLIGNLVYKAIHSQLDIRSVHPLLLELKNCPIRTIREEVVQAFPWTCPKEEAVFLLLEAFSDEQKFVRRSTLESLILLQSEKMLEFFQTHFDPQNTDIALDILWGLKELGKKDEYRPAVLAYLSSLLPQPKPRIHEALQIVLTLLQNWKEGQVETEDEENLEESD
jgi:HEAT repeat protein